MNTLILTREQIEQKRHEAAALFSQELSNAEIGRRIGISRPTVSGWRQLWQAQGMQGLQLHKPGPDPRLTQAQVQQVLEALLKGPQAHGFPTPLWTLERIADVIQRETNVHYHPGYVWELLRQWNWSPQKPEAVAQERDDAEIARWQSEDWPRIKKGAQKQSATLAFLDESGFSLQPSVRRTWAPRGQTPVIRTHFNWKRLNVIGSLLCQPDGSQADLLLHFQPNSVKDEAIIAYLRLLHQQVGGRIVLLWDRLPAHRSAAVAEYLAANADWLHVEWLPAYAPELNPIEYVWSDAKGEPTANNSPDTLSDIEHSLMDLRKQLVSNQDLMYGFLEASTLFPKKEDRSLT